ncbi:7-carboxy-7-deazaguanine synthase [Sphingobium nicotianae]|uniref:7-carboxy-7-deazaguanine synthase n=1 Tax=Sphingobium nicotianae TaxID=2782607 RepID=A0A9X1DFH7_9SPHN|nr:7-carboxy-7-deazaguanine synthase [Sphingobium nicotianae]MBT2188929.1 7-carboxy-7-deazaguanine synthase [Sphingobium nicotianae]
MTYAVKEMFLTLQGEGLQAGRRAVFLRFAGCNLWSGREADRAGAICRFCDTDFVGTDGENGGKFATPEALAAAAGLLWGEEPGDRFLVVTGGEPMLQLDPPLVEALHKVGFEIAVESNGTLPATPGIDWLCISPKAGSEVVQRSGDELKLVWPQQGIDPEALFDWDFRAYLVQPMDRGSEAANRATHEAAIALVMSDCRWRLSLQTHKLLGLK